MSDTDSSPERVFFEIGQTSLDSDSSNTSIDTSDSDSDCSDSTSASPKDSVYKTYGAVKISLIKDEIKNQQVDVIVNSTSSALDLRQGAASRALLKAAGDSVQQECKDNYPNGVTATSIAVTGGGNLSCSHIYHISLQKWEEEESKKVLTKLVLNCLKQASTAGLTSIAIPALGTGLLKYDVELVAKCMCSCVRHFEKHNTGTSLTDVRFIIFPSDTATHDAFFKRMRGRGEESEATTDVQSGKVGQIEVKLVTGQLINQDCEIVMATGTRKLEMSKGNLSKFILEKAGSSLQTECENKYPNGIQHGEIAVLSPGDLSCKKIFIGALPRFDKQVEGPLNASELLTKLVKTCLQEASNANLASICFPPLGTGYLKCAPDTSASLLFTAIQDFAVNNATSSLRTVVIVIHTDSSTVSEKLEPFKSKHRAIIPTPKAKPVPLPRRTGQVSVPRSVSAKVKSRLSSKHLMQIEQSLSRPLSAKLMSEKLRAVPVLPMPVLPRPIPQTFPNSSSEEEEVCVDGASAVPSRNTPEYCMHMSQLEISPPPYWTTYTKDKTVKQWRVAERGKPGYVLVDVNASRFNSINKLVTRTWQKEKVGQGRDAKGLENLGTSGIKVTKVQRIENLKLYETYRQNQQNLFHKAGEGSIFKKLSEKGAKFGDPKTESHLDDVLKDTLYSEVNEGLFFHGTKSKNVDGLIKNGIDPRLAQGQAVFGQGIYMAESSTKADQYADERGDDSRRKDNLKMFLVRCSLGDICLMKTEKKFRRPPCCVPDCLKDTCDHDKRYDSVVEEERYIFREFVVYDSGQTYPEYLITYDRV